MSSIPSSQTCYGYTAGLKVITKFERPVVMPTGEQCLVKIHAAGMCALDVHMMWGQEKELPNQFVMGHEIAGEIVVAGPQHPYEVGTRVAMQISNACGRCRPCRTGHDNVCSTVGSFLSGHVYGLSADGGYQQYLLVKNVRLLLPIPKGVSYAQAAVASDAVLTPYHLVKHSGVAPGLTVLLTGLGGLGLNALQVLKRLYNCKVYAVDPKPETKELAAKFGADQYFSLLEDAAAWLTKEGIEVDASFDFVGIQDTFNLAAKFTRPCGLIVPPGLHKSRTTYRTLDLNLREITICGTSGGSSAEQLECMELIARGIITPTVKVLPMDHLPVEMDKLAKNQIVGRVAFVPGPPSGKL